MSTTYTLIEGGPCDGVPYHRPKDELVAYGDDGVWRYRYELDDRGRMVWDGTREPLGLDALEAELMEVLR